MMRRKFGCGMMRRMFSMAMRFVAVVMAAHHTMVIYISMARLAADVLGTAATKKPLVVDTKILLPKVLTKGKRSNATV